MGREEAENPEMEAAKPRPLYRAGLPQGYPVPKALDLASPPPFLTGMKHNWGTVDSVLQSRVLAALSIRDVRGEVKKRSWPGQWRRDQITFSCPRH